MTDPKLLPLTDPKPLPLTLRPYQLMCAVCAHGDESGRPEDAMSRMLLDAIRENPDIPIALRCDMGEVYLFQTSGPDADTPEGAEFNKRRDLEILLRLNVPPGTTLSARILINRMLDRIAEVAGICAYGQVTSPAWEGCAKAGSGCYERARAQGADGILPPRCPAEMARDKTESLQAMYGARTTGIEVKPHLLLCAVCQYGGGTRPPYPPDNLPELIQLLLEAPDTLIRMTEGAPWMMCGPCGARAPRWQACVNVKGSGGLTNQLRDLRTLQLLGLAFGDTMKAGELYRLVFARIPSTPPVCAFDSPSPSVWWDNCGEANCSTGNAGYEQGRAELMDKLGR